MKCHNFWFSLLNDKEQNLDLWPSLYFMSFKNPDEVFRITLLFIHSAIHQPPQCIVLPNTFLLGLLTIERIRTHILLWSYTYQTKAVTVLLLRHQGSFHQASSFQGSGADEGIFHGLQVVLAAMSCTQSGSVQYAFSSINTQQLIRSPYRTLYWQYTQTNLFLGEDNENLALVISPQTTHLTS